MRWLCLFNPCRWRHIQSGIWQCTRCKTVDRGAPPTPTAFNPDWPTG